MKVSTKAHLSSLIRTATSCRMYEKRQLVTQDLMGTDQRVHHDRMTQIRELVVVCTRRGHAIWSLITVLEQDDHDRLLETGSLIDTTIMAGCRMCEKRTR